MRIPGELAATLAAVVDQGSFEAAARTLHITQSAVTQRVQTLERIVGQVLLVRSRPARATSAGRMVVRYARQVELLTSEVNSSLGIDGGQRPTLAIGVNADSLATWFLDPLENLSSELDVVFDLRRDDEGRTADLLSEGTVAAAVTTSADAVPGCSVTQLGSMVYRAHASTEFAERWFPHGVTPAALDVAPVIDIDIYDTLQTRYLDAHGADATKPPRHRIPAAAEFVRAIEFGMGWAVLPAAQSERATGLVDLGGDGVVVPLYWQQWRVNSPLLDRVSEVIATAARKALVTN